MLQERESLATLGIEGCPCPRCRGPTREDGEAVQHLGAGTFPPPDNGYGRGTISKPNRKISSLLLLVAALGAVLGLAGCSGATAVTDTAPAFADTATVPNQTYTVGEAITGLNLPEAGGGNGPLSYTDETLWIHRGDESFGGGNRNILIHTDRAERRENGDFPPSGPGNYLEEVLLHEGVHTSLDEIHELAPGWLAAQAADPTFISTYAQDHPAREDLAESFVPYMIVRYRANRATEAMVDMISVAIPHRIAYLDAELSGSWCPVVQSDCP